MSLRQTMCCDQCGAEVDAGRRNSAGWHSLQIHDLTIGKQAQFDLCHDCWTAVRIPELMDKTTVELVTT